MNNPSPSSRSISKYTPWLIWTLATLFYLYENVVQVSPGVMVPDLMKAFSINSAALGSLIAFFFYSYASMQIPVGVLVDHYSARVLLTIAALSCALGCVLFGTASGLLMIALGRLMIGFGAAFAAVCVMKLASTWFSPSKFSLLVGLMVTMGMLGSMIGETPLAILVECIGWRHAMLVLALVGLLLAISIALIVRHRPPETTPHTTAPLKTSKTSTVPSLLHGLLTVLKSGQSWIVAAYGGLMFASTSIFGGLWGVPFLMKAYELEKPAAAGIVSIMFLGWVVGSPLSGVLTTLLRSYKKTLFISSTGALTVLVAVLYIPHLPLPLLSGLIFCFGLFSSFFLPSFTLMRELHTDASSGAALGFMNSANMIGGAVGQPFIGLLLDARWDGALSNGVRVYSIADYQYSLSCLPIVIFLSVILIPFIHEKRG